MRVIFAFAFMLLSLVGPTLAQPEDAPWQAVVTGQIEAFRAGDGAAALTFAGEGFRTRFEGQPENFFAAVLTAGYAPIANSRTHSFGEFNRLDETTVLQTVNFVGRDQQLHDAIYQMTDEPGEGWRVQGVALRKVAGVGI